MGGFFYTYLFYYAHYIPKKSITITPKFNKHNIMKKITLLAIACVAISFVSCKKDYTCSCTKTGEKEPYYTTTFNNTKSAAQASCTKIQYSNDVCVIK